MRDIQITTPGIKKALNRYDVKQSIAEYIWNGFDAKATEVDIKFESSPLGSLLELSITDNGEGIPLKNLATKFTPFFESEKEIDPNTQRATSAVHGKNGVGRLTFFTFALKAKWVTVYEEKEKCKNYSYEIEIKADSLRSYSDPTQIETSAPTGTTVIFSGLHNIAIYNFETDIKEFLMTEFGWFLELNHSKQYAIRIDGIPLDYSALIGDRDTIRFNEEKTSFEVQFVRWNQSLREFSRYYFINSDNEETHKETTTLNKKGDQFFHSVYVKSTLFDRFSAKSASKNNGDNQQYLFGQLRSEKAFKALMTKLDDFLKQKRKPFLKQGGDHLIHEMENNGAFPNFGENEWDKYRKAELELFIQELYQVEPKIFSRLNIEQQKTFVHLLNLVMDAGEQDSLLTILSQIVELSNEERKHLAETLRVTTLSNVIKTIKLIEDRYKAISAIKDLVLSPEVKANEPNHIQKAVESHYWLFGEQYHLVTAAEPKFEEALRRFVYLLRGEKMKKKKLIDHPDKNREMDIFMVRQQVIDSDQIVKNVCVELKHPDVKLGKKELDQVDKYMEVILNQDDFNGNNMFWEFYLIGNSFDKTGYIERHMEHSRSHGEKSLVFSVDKYKIYVKKWSEIFADFELRHTFLLDKLKLERHNLISEEKDANLIVQKLKMNTAKQAGQVQVPV